MSNTLAIILGNIPKSSKPLVISRQLKILLACARQVKGSRVNIRRTYSFTAVAEHILLFMVSTTLEGQEKQVHLIQPFAMIVVPSWSEFILPFMPLIRMREPT
jgi:hypothetical protein